MRPLLVLSLVSAVSASSSSKHVPLVRRARSGIVTLESLAAQREALDVKYGSRGSSKLKSRQATSAAVPMTNQFSDVTYFGIMNVGTPPASYGVALDTGSSDLWFQSGECSSCTDGIKLQTTSTSLQQSGTPFSIRYGSGAVAGHLVSDVVEMGGYTIQNQVMGLVTNASGNLLAGQEAGLLGLAFRSLAESQSAPFWEALVSSGRWSEPLMSFWMTRYTNVTSARDEEHGGEFRMGGTNATLYTGDIEYHDLPANINSFWMIPLQQIAVNGGEPMLITNLGVTSLAVIDTGTTLIGGPPDLVADIYSQIPGSQRGTGNLDRYWIYPCGQTISLTFNFGGRAWSMAPEDFQLRTNDPTLCVGSLFEIVLGGLGNPDVPQWIIGDAFLKNVYSVFRYTPPSVGFAQLTAFAATAGTGQDPPALSNAPAPSATATGSGQPPLIPTRTGSSVITATGTPLPPTANGAAVYSWSVFGSFLSLLVGAFIAI